VWERKDLDKRVLLFRIIFKRPLIEGEKRIPVIRNGGAFGEEGGERTKNIVFLELRNESEEETRKSKTYVRTKVLLPGEYVMFE